MASVVCLYKTGNNKTIQHLLKKKNHQAFIISEAPCVWQHSIAHPVSYHYPEKNLIALTKPPLHYHILMPHLLLTGAGTYPHGNRSSGYSKGCSLVAEHLFCMQNIWAEVGEKLAFSPRMPLSVSVDNSDVNESMV